MIGKWVFWLRDRYSMALFDNADCLLSTPVAVLFVKGLRIPFLELPPMRQ